MDLDVEGLYNVHKLQGSHDVNDQKRLIKLLNILSSENGWTVCASLLTGSSELPSPDSLPEVQKSALIFLCCRAIEDYLKSDSLIKEDEPRKFAEFILRWLKKFTCPDRNHGLPKYLEAKASQLTCLAILRYYPHHWASLFDDLVLLLTDVSDEQNNHCSPTLVAIDLFLDTLLNLDAYLVSRDLQLTTEEVAKGNEIKDSLRASSITSLMGTCYQLINHLLSLDVIPSAHIRKALQTVGLYAAWVDLSLVAGSEWVTLLSRLLQISTNATDGPVMRTGAYAYLTGIVNKGMPPVDKLILINGIWEQLGTLLLVDTTNSNSTDETELDDTLIESLCGLATLIDAMGLQLIDIYRILLESGTPAVSVSMASMTANGNSESLVNLTIESMEARLNMAIHLFQHKDQQVGHLLVPFLRAYLSLLKTSNPPGSSGISQSISGRRSRNRNSSTSLDSGSLNCSTTNGTSGFSNVLELTESRVFLLKRLLFTFMDQLKSLPLYCPTETGEDEYEEYRHDLRTLIGNVIQLDPGFVLGMISQMVKHAVQTIGEIRQSSTNPSQTDSDRLGEIDATLSLFYLFGETCKAPKNDHFTPTFPWNMVMCDIMRTLCSDAFLNLPHWVLQLQYFEIMARYDHYFALAPEHLFQIMVSLVDHRGLHSPWRDVRKRCPYLISRLIKTHRKTLAPHAEELLSLFSDLLPLCLEPDLTNGQDHTQPNGTAIGNGVHGNGSTTTTATTNVALGIIEQGFLYEAAAQLIAAHGSDENSERLGHLSRALLNPVLIQYHELVEKYAQEKDAKFAEARGNLVRQAADLITRTIRVFYQPKSAMIFGSQSIVLQALNLMVEDLGRFPTEAASPGRAAACAGVRAFLHRMIASSGPSQSGGDSSDLLLSALVRAVPQLVKPLEINQPNLPNNQGIWSSHNVLDAEQRWKEVRDIIPLFVQVISRFKTQSASFLSACLPGLLIAIRNALAEPLPSDHPTLAEERKLLRRGYLQLVENIAQSLPQAFFELMGPNIVESLSAVLAQTEACIEADDPLGLRSSLVLFCQLIQTTALDPCFYQEFLLLKFVPFCVISPTRTTFRLTDAQFGLALNELANCLHHLARLQDGFVAYLRDFYLPQQQLSPDLVQSYVAALKSPNVKDFQTFIRNFYAAFR